MSSAQIINLCLKLEIYVPNQRTVAKSSLLAISFKIERAFFSISLTLTLFAAANFSIMHLIRALDKMCSIVSSLLYFDSSGNLCGSNGFMGRVTHEISQSFRLSTSMSTNIVLCSISPSGRGDTKTAKSRNTLGDSRAIKHT